MSGDLQARTVRGVGWSTVQSWSLRLIGFVVYPVLARILGPETYGLIALAGVFITILDIFSDVSFGAAIEQRRDLKPQHLDSIFWAFLGLGLVLSMGSILAAPLVAGFFREPALPPIIRWLSAGFFLQMCCGVQISLLRRDLRIKALTTQALASTIAGSVVGVVMALSGAGVWSLVGQRLVMRVVSVVMIWRFSPWRPRREFSASHFREVAGFGFSVMGNRLLSYLNQRLDQFLVGRFLGTTQLGFYFNAHRLMQLATGLLVGSYSQVAMPAFAALQDDLPRFRAAFNKACRFVSLVAFPAFAGLAVLGEDLIVVVLGAQWQPSGLVLQILALSGIVLAIQYVNGAAMMALGRANLRLLLLAVYGVCNTVAFIVAVRHGIVAVAAAYTICAYALAPLDTLLNRRLGAVSVRALLRAIRSQAIATVVMAAGLLALTTMALQDTDAWPRLLIATIVGVTVYAVVLYAVEPGLWRDVRGLVRHLRTDRRAGQQADHEPDRGPSSEAPLVNNRTSPDP